ncbi:MAG TPA: hypothetical protein DHN29_14150 [Cytophagales bacterium]|nr:hypothetical protein [Cytophagales bacterium]|tara:strand:+ start:425 stop:646 length:222 start_codon:yes stop_codon:yes gene_type:complete
MDYIVKVQGMAGEVEYPPVESLKEANAIVREVFGCKYYPADLHDLTVSITRRGELSKTSSIPDVVKATAVTTP